ncbi:alpha/beta hydrolase [Candidatus Nitronereus thalassa]|uniref:Prolyl oligopeptidase family serine peptidase n=1 Tax=Candidatus Nitronereus thalassa TaxID=3020898 RepID=A0ABU3KBI3_9BACT|nr:CocE/NonD family hydrolase [Candidatus Nitronereus thalassa]MDT7043527.1 prolyl oligopeptidase family serine peptidase [Candidatus Nitronereus thalassa]
MSKFLFFLLGFILFLPLLNLLLGLHPLTFKTDVDPSHFGLAYEPVEFTTADHLVIRGWFIPASPSAPTPTQKSLKTIPTIVVGHGYPFDKANILRHVLFLHQRFHLLLMDFRYFGESEGWITTVGIREPLDVKAALDYLNQRGDIDTTRIGAMGFSMSAAIFVLTQDPRIRAIVADSPYASLAKIVEHQYFFVPRPLNNFMVNLTGLYARMLFGLEMDHASPEKTVHTLETPLLLIHGEDDSQIQTDHSQAIFTNANQTHTTLWLIPGADHGQAHAIAGFHYELRVLDFFTAHLN